MRPRPGTRPALPQRRAARLLTAWLLAVLLLAGCTMVERQVVSVDEQARREVAILTGTPAPDPPPSAKFAALTPLQVEIGLKRLIVEPSTWTTLLHDPPTAFLSPEQVGWARDAIAAELPRLRAQQRLQLRFRDRFHQFGVEVELYGEGANLVYRFTRLASQDEQPGDTLGEKPTRPIAWVRLVEQPGQQVDTDRKAYILREALFATNVQGQSLAELAAAIDQAQQERKLPAQELESVRALLRGQPAFSLEALRLYLDKLETLLRAREQGLFTREEADARKQKLLEELVPASARQ
jgi:hypothetical protein